MIKHLLKTTRHDKGGSYQVEFSVNALVIGGWTGRNPEEIECHISELEAIGVERPERIPSFFRIPNDRLLFENALEVVGNESSGEIEIVIFYLEDGLWIGVGSDHTDRKLEAYSVPISKQVCAKPVASDVWRFDEIQEHWDQLQLRAFVFSKGIRRLYQDGSVNSLLSPGELSQKYRGGIETVPIGTVMFGGTIPVIGEISDADRFEMELEDPVLGRKIQHAYEIIRLPAEEYL